MMGGLLDFVSACIVFFGALIAVNVHVTLLCAFVVY
jgi:hypothetical protein